MHAALAKDVLIIADDLPARGAQLRILTGTLAGTDKPNVNAVRAAGLSDADIADVVFAVAARAFFTKVLDGLGARLDQATAATFEPDLLQAMIVGNPVGDS